MTIPDFAQLAENIKQWGHELGFQQIGISDIELSTYEKNLRTWLDNNFHGTMDYMARHGNKRSQPQQLIPGTCRVITARMDYLPPINNIKTLLANKTKAVISRYALGRDYHKLIRKRLTQLSERINQQIAGYHYRAFADSAPVMEKPLAEKSGLGWIGKHTNLINRHAGSWFFLGTLYTDLPLPIDKPTSAHCGSCTRCLEVCPTKAIVAPYQLDARRCISYLTIELRGSIPEEFRPLIGNRIYGCDDCQLCCPWNRYAKLTDEHAFHPRHGLEDADLITLFLWSEEKFLQNTEGSAIRRIGYECWLRNLAIGLGNAPTCPEIIDALQQRQNYPSDLVKEHVAWALQRHQVISASNQTSR